MLRLLLMLFIFSPACLAARVLVDLSYPFDQNTIYWPTEKGFQLSVISFGKTPKDYFYSANKFCAPEHGGTHLDAPLHFSRHGRSVDKIPPQQLLGSLIVIDLRSRIKDSDYQISQADIKNFEQHYRHIQAGDIVFFFTGWGKYWPNKKKYLGTDRLDDLKHLHFPGLSAEAANYLISKDIKGIGIDTASMDPGQSTNFPVHRIILGAGKYGIENVAYLDKLPPLGAKIIVAPMKIAGGSGAPTRLFASFIKK